MNFNMSLSHGLIFIGAMLAIGYLALKNCNGVAGIFTGGHGGGEIYSNRIAAANMQHRGKQPSGY